MSNSNQIVDRNLLLAEIKQIRPNILPSFKGEFPAAVSPSERKTLLAGPDLVIEHGSRCQSATGQLITVEDSFDLPTSSQLPNLRFGGAVFLNGWSLKYLEKDHHVWAAGTWITNSRIEGGTLKWEATGLLVDEKPDDPYEWCYYYTVVAWHPRFLHIVAEHDDVENMTRSSVRRSPLISVPSYFQSERYASEQEIVVLPRGFAFRQSGLEDSHLQHIAYNLTHSESFIENKKYGILDEPPLTPLTGKAGSGYVSWETQAIFSSSSYRNYHFHEWNATLGGASVRQLQPPFTILPTNVRENIGGGRQGETTHSIVIGNIPFDYAVPMLTGWDLQYDFGNAEHITKVGVWLTDFEYKRRTGENIGTLRYDVTSALYDKDKQPGYSFRHKVSILGFESSLPEDVPPITE